MLLEHLGPVWYDLATLGENMLNIFKFRQDNLGMKDLRTVL